MNTFLFTNPMIKNLWESFAESKEYRDNFVAAFVKRSIPSQIRTWMKKQGIATQEELARRSGITQGVISRAANPKYGDLTLNTIINIGSGLDCVFVGRYVPYSEFCKMVVEDSFAEDSDTMLSFEEEDKKLKEEQQVRQMRRDKSEPIRIAATIQAKIAEEDALVQQLGEGIASSNKAAGQLGRDNNVIEFARKDVASVPAEQIDQFKMQQEACVNGR